MAWLRKRRDGPIVLKGILNPMDAKKAVEYGMDGTVVSNYGAREQDGSAASLDMLLLIRAAAGNAKIDIFFDSGNHCAADI